MSNFSQNQGQTLTATSEADRKHLGLFSELKIKDITLRNRIAVSPMCQYNSIDGLANDWHLVHLGSRAIGGAALVITEAAAVEAIGRICPDDLGIWSDDQIAPLKKITTFIESFGAVPGIQIAHAGRKASTRNPWKDGGSRHEKQNVPESDGGWQPVGPSALPFSDNSITPRELSIAEIEAIQDKFAQAAERAYKAGFKWLEVHAAHGYLLHSFYSPLSNKRTDKYGGSLENRMRNALETIDKVRKVWPQNLPLTVRISASDWVEGGWSVDDSVILAAEMKKRGVDLIDCSSAFVRAGDRYQYGPGWQVPLAKAVKEQAQILTGAVGMITEAQQADQIIKNGEADLVFLAREMIRDPYWPYHAAQELMDKAEAKKILPVNYSYAI
jgi:2,4-dienoyl-CoA reductase-like NADH-dependent reductase (Old Yellow Enzyme family)